MPKLFNKEGKRVCLEPTASLDLPLEAYLARISFNSSS